MARTDDSANHLAAYAHRLRMTNPLREPALRAAIADLDLPDGSRGLDAGCGIGLHTIHLAKAIGPRGLVTGLDLSPEFLELARGNHAQGRLSRRFSALRGDINRVPARDGAFDWAWSVDTVYAGVVGDPMAITRELARVVRPGGIVALLFWAGQKLLPGHAELEAHLDASFAESAPYLRGIAPERQFTCGLGWLRAAGLSGVRARTFATDLHAPLDEDSRSALELTMRMLWGESLPALAPSDRATLARLWERGSDDWILDRPDYHASVIYTMFAGRKPE